MPPTPAEMVLMMREVFASLDDACTGLTEEQWNVPTEVPGWSVKDNLSHICGIEEMLLGRERPGPIAEPWPPHVKNPFGAINEGDCQKRRPWPGGKVLDEFRELAPLRVKELESYSDEKWESTTQGVFGESKTRDWIAIRLADCYCHEQDIRRATGREGNLDSAVASFVIGRLASVIPRILIKDVQAPDGTVVAFDITSGPHKSFALRVEGDRANPTDADAIVTIRTTSAGLERLLAGRWDIDAAIEDGRVAVEGDTSLGRKILDQIAVTP